MKNHNVNRKRRIKMDPNKRINRMILLIVFSIILILFFRRPIKVEKKPYIAIDDEILLNETLDDDKFLTYDIVKKYIDPYLFFDNENNLLIITTENMVRKYDFNSNLITENMEIIENDNSIILDGGNLKFNIDYISKNYGYDTIINPKRKQIIINTKKGEIGTISKRGKNIYNATNRFARKYNKKLRTGDKVFIYKEIDNYYKIRTEDGILGYIHKDNLKKDEYSSSVKNNERIHLTWDFVHKKTTDTILSNIKPLDGITHISPTWFEMSSDGSLIDKGSSTYVKKYNALNIDVWPTITNGFDPHLTEEILSDSFKRERLVYEIVENYKKYQVQGINIDFENIHLETKDYLVQFVRELYPLLKQEGMDISMDITTISTSTNWSKSYDRKKLGDSVDYLVLMAYDQYWASSPIPGSVAEYPWVQNGVEELLNYVDSEKIILGIPLYWRLWIGEEGDLKSKSLKISMGKEFVENNKIELNWDENIRQYYGYKEIEGKMNRIWLEDENSLVEKVSLVRDYNLKGIASWRKGYEEEGLFKILEEELLK